MTRLTRAEQQAKTRGCLMEAAARVFARRGLQRASIDEVAEEAGYTKGAFYANFKSKEELFLAMLDERFAERLEELERLVDDRELDLESRTRRAGAEFTAAIRADPEWERLYFEFAAHAMRNDDFREELVTRTRALREAKTRAFGRLMGEKQHAMALEDVARVTFAMANGLALEQMLEPDAVSEELYGTLLYVFFTGLKTLAEADGERLASTRGARRAAST